MKLIEIAKEYHKQCDEFDNKVCTGRNKYGESQPTNAIEHNLINKNARLCLSNAYNKGRNNCYSKEEVLKAIQKYNIHK